jgi:ribose transport system ATP-binding protein
MNDQNEAAALPAASPPVPVVALRHVSKNFGGALALSDVAFKVMPGEVHGLLGQNGSGKSTLIKILAGFHAAEPGAALDVNGEPVHLPLAPGQFRMLGMSFVHQDLALIPSLTTTENLRLGHLATTRRWRISWARERRRAAETFARYRVGIDPEAAVADVGQIQRALLAIVRAVEDLRSERGGEPRPGLLVLDEATAFLPKQGIEQLFALIREVVAAGDSVVFVSHNLEEVLNVTDRVTVLRDGRVVGTVRTANASHAGLVHMIIGRHLEAMEQTEPHRIPTDVVASIEDLSGPSVKGVTFHLRKAEVLGLTGLLGAGFEEIPYLMFGARRAAGGRLSIGERQYDARTMSPSAAIRSGMALVPADRQNDGSIGSLSTADNVSMQVLDSYSNNVLLNRRLLLTASQTALRRFDVRPPNPRLEYQALSGGNQQKVLLAKWLQSAPALLLLHEPTIGVDVGARAQIFAILRDAVAHGTSIVCASSDYDQLASICDRVLVIARGSIVRELTGTEVTKERIAEQCLAHFRGQMA